MGSENRAQVAVITFACGDHRQCAKIEAMDLQLDAVEARVLGSLLEKEIATPEYYPLSLNALVNACNQKSNREPVVS